MALFIIEPIFDTEQLFDTVDLLHLIIGAQMRIAGQPETKPTRVQRRRIATRARLITGAREVFARKGTEATTIADITESADVGLGTFYHHFVSKEDIMRAVTAEVAENLGPALDRATAGMSDPAEVMAACIRHVVRKVKSDPIWGWFVLKSGVSLPDAPAALLRRNLRDLQRGVDARRFIVTDVATAHAAVCGAIVGVIHAHLANMLSDDADQHLAAQVLRLLGIAADEAEAIARRPLPTVTPTVPQSKSEEQE